MAQHLVGSNAEFAVVDKRKAVGGPLPNTRDNSGVAVFTANATGSTTTIVGANAAPATNDTNVIRRTDKFMLYTSAGVPKENTVFQVSSIAVAASTTVTFTPAAAAATASGDVARLVGLADFMDNQNLDARLNAINSTSYTQARLDTMTQNDKIYAIRVEQDSGTTGGL